MKTEEEKILAHREADKRWREKRMRENPFKKCTRCGEIKPLDDFKFIFSSASSNRKFGSKRKKCRHEKYLETKETDRERAEKYYKENKEHVLELSRKRRKSNLPKEMLRSARERAKRKGFDFNIDETDIKIPDKCPVLGIPLFPGKGKPQSNSPTIDRIDSTKGYIKGNVIVVSYRANTIKSDAIAEEIRKVADFYEKLQRK